MIVLMVGIAQGMWIGIIGIGGICLRLSAEAVFDRGVALVMEWRAKFRIAAGRGLLQEWSWES